MIKTCTCKHEYQDKTYGPKKRVHTVRTKSGTGNLRYTCTVCGKES